MKWLMDDSISPDVGISLAEMRVAPGALSESHHHDNCTETIHCLSGPISQRIGSDWIVLKTGDTCVIPIGVKHQSRNDGDDEAVLMIAYSAGKRNYSIT